MSREDWHYHGVTLEPTPVYTNRYHGVTLEPTPVYTNRLQNVECGRVSQENERGWTAHLTDDDEVAVYCPDCDRRRFGA